MISPKTNTQVEAVPKEQQDWHVLDIDAVAQELQVNPSEGLSEDEAARRLETYGPNELTDTGVKNPLLILWEQLTDPMVMILIGAAVVSLFLGELKSVVAIMAIVVLNALLGVSQEYRAEQAMAALKKMAAPSVRVRRSGNEKDIASDAIVPGDIVLVEAGSIVPADGRVLSSKNLSVQEASLTGESLSVEKHISRIDNPLIPIGDRMNMIYMGTAVTYGRGEAVITSTAMGTELGRIAELIQNVESEQTPLQRRMAEVGKMLFYSAIGIVILATFIGALNMDTSLPFIEAITPVFIAAVAIAVAVVPEGLPAVVTIALALGAQRMLRRRALIRKLPAVETLGSVTVICSDKTGTLTQNKMTVTVVDIANKTEHVDHVEINRQGQHIFSGDFNYYKPHSITQTMLLHTAAMSNDASVNQAALENDEVQVIGDPTEAALLTVAASYGLHKRALETLMPRVDEIPFSSERKRMTTIHRIDDHPTIVLDDQDQRISYISGPNGKTYQYIALAKGAVDSMLDVCGYVMIEGEMVNMTPDLYERINMKNDQLAEQGLRVLGFAYRVLDTLPDDINVDTVETDLVFTGMVGMIDPPRAEVQQAVGECLQAGIRPVMITGDHPLTAFSIARQLKIVGADDAPDNGQILTGRELANMSIKDLETAVDTVSVFARVSPEHKLNIVQALQNKGNIVAMTGDGVNDAPALKRADIGVAMGITGTAVSKEASEMVILDDNFATIVEAAEEGRTIYDNVRKFIKYILASNLGEVGVLFITQLAGMPLPLNTLQILWMNLVTDGLPALALSVEKGEPDAMDRPPHDPQESVFSRGLGWYLIRIGVLIGVLGLAVVLLFPNDDPAWGTMIFTTLVFSQMGHALAIRSERDSVFSIGLFSNMAMVGAIGLTVVLQIALLYVPFLQDFFGTVPLTLEQFLIAVGLSMFTFAGVELDKWFFERRRKNRVKSETTVA